jgi:hypothetical protein
MQLEVFYALLLHENLKLTENFYTGSLDVTYPGLQMADGIKHRTLFS